MKYVWLVCGNEAFKWPDVPPTFKTIAPGGATLEWNNPKFYGEVLGVKVYDYSWKSSVGDLRLHQSLSSIRIPDPLTQLAE